MTMIFKRFSPRQLRFAAVLCLSVLSAVPGAFATAKVEVFQATAPVADRSEAAQGVAFQSALRTVLVRVTGRRTAGDDPALAPLVSNARRYVQQYRSAPDNQLWVAFDSAAIERWLTQNNQPLWGRDRPVTYLWVGVQSGAQGGTLLTAEDQSELKTSIDAAASVRGIPVMWPNTADLQRNRVDYSSVAGGSPAALVDLAKRAGADGVLIGRASNLTAAASVRWTLQYQDRSSEFSGPFDGVNRTADLYASLFAASGALAPVDIEVSGVSELRDYAAVETYLESLSFITHVDVVDLNHDVVRFRLTTRGGADTLQRALTLSGRLTAEAAGEDGVQRFKVRR